MEDILTEIKEAEKKSEKIVEEAAIKKQEIIQKARQDSIQMISGKEAELDQELKKEIDNRTLEFDNKKKELIVKSKKEAELLEKKSKDKIQTIINYVMDKFEESLG